MPHSLGRIEFFVREAGEYLARLAPILAHAGHDKDAAFVQLARALRGAAMMAGPPGFARAAASLEGMAKALRDRTHHWDAAVSGELRTAHATFERLVAHAKDWDDEEREAVADLTHQLDDLLGAPPPIYPRAGATPDATPGPGLLTFVQQEAARIASGARSLATDGDVPRADLLRTVLDQMHSLRGLAPHPNLASLSWVLEGLEALINDLLRGYPPPPSLATILELAAPAILAAGQGLEADQQHVPPVIDQFGIALYEGFAREEDVIPIEEILLSPEPTLPPSGLNPPADPMDLVSLGDRLRHAASQLRDASPSARRFHLHALAASLRAIHPTDPRASEAIATQSILRTIHSGSAFQETDTLVLALQAMAQPLNEAPDTSLEDVLQDLIQATHLLPHADGPSPVPPAVEEGGDTAIVPIESLLYDAEPADGVTDQPRTTFERSFSNLHRLIQNAPPVSAAPEHTMARTDEIVSIDTLLYRGEHARRRLDHVCTTLRATAGADTASLTLLIDEIVDLVPLALDDA